MVSGDELGRARPRMVVLAVIAAGLAAGLAGCSSEATRFGDNRYARSAPQQQLQTEHGLDQSPTHIDSTQTQAAELAVEREEIELGAALLL